MQNKVTLLIGNINCDIKIQIFQL